MKEMVRDWMKKKYLFTQLSGLFIGLLSGSTAFILMKHNFPHFVYASYNKIPNAVILSFIVLMAYFIGVLSWGKVLVRIGILTKKEAKGYPYSKPWLEEDN